MCMSRRRTYRACRVSPPAHQHRPNVGSRRDVGPAGGAAAAMSPVSDQQWLRQIGVDVTADTDDEDADVSDDPVELDDDASAETDDEPPNSRTRRLLLAASW